MINSPEGHQVDSSPGAGWVLGGLLLQRFSGESPPRLLQGETEKRSGDQIVIGRTVTIGRTGREDSEEFHENKVGCNIRSTEQSECEHTVHTVDSSRLPASRIWLEIHPKNVHREQILLGALSSKNHRCVTSGLFCALRHEIRLQDRKFFFFLPSECFDKRWREGSPKSYREICAFMVGFFLFCFFFMENQVMAPGLKSFVRLLLLAVVWEMNAHGATQRHINPEVRSHMSGQVHTVWKKDPVK